MLLVLGAALMQSAFANEARNLAVTRTDAPASETRVALVIGNSAYKNSPLKNPVNDAKAMSAKLKTLGFEVIERNNLTQKQIGSVLREFRSRLKPGAVALFFYAGHGLQVKGVNYLPVVDADIASEEDVPLQSLNMNQVLELMDEAKTRMNLVFLDACRNNPYARSFRSAADGLAKVNAPSGTIISFATRPGSVAADGSGKNGLYTQHLLANMDLPQPVEQVLKRVVSGVKQASKGRQEPWMEGSIEGDFYFHPGEATQVASLKPEQVRVQSAEEIEQELWNGIKDSQDVKDFESYLATYTGGRFAVLARQKLKALAAPVATPAVNVASGESLRDCPDCPEMIAIPGKDYALGKYEVTQAEWQAVMGNNPSHFSSCGDNCPVENVSWNDVHEFIQKLNQKTGRQYRLPIGSEWEYACYGGSQTEYCGGNDINAVAWYHGNSGGQTHPVGQKQANGYGLYDMSGNVWEWMENKYDSEHDWRVVRGGSWFNTPQFVRAAARSEGDATDRGNDYGFRLARTLPPHVASDGSEAIKEEEAKVQVPVMIAIPGKNYEMGKFEVTRGQFAEFVNETGYDTGGKCWTYEGGKAEERSGRNWRNLGFTQDDNHPVSCVNWNDAQAYISWLSKKAGKQYRLPKEIEWEYACYGGSQTEYCGSNDINAVAWYGYDEGSSDKGNSSQRTQPVGQKQANGYGLYDMSGNVWECMEDCWEGGCEYRVLRGGSYGDGQEGARAANRIPGSTTSRSRYYGFCLARTLPMKPTMTPAR